LTQPDKLSRVEPVRQRRHLGIDLTGVHVRDQRDHLGDLAGMVTGDRAHGHRLTRGRQPSRDQLTADPHPWTQQLSMTLEPLRIRGAHPQNILQKTPQIRVARVFPLHSGNVVEKLQLKPPQLSSGRLDLPHIHAADHTTTYDQMD
jgi:hypothetical protein